MSVDLINKPKRRPHHYFIPSEYNDHQPHFVRHKALHFYSALLIGIKVFILVTLFITFPSIAEFSTVTSNRIIELTNKTRQEEGLPVLMHSSLLDQAAMLKAQNMLEENYFAHDSPSGFDPWEWFKQIGYNYTFAGENLAMNFSEAEDAMQAWLASPTHKANILNANYDEIGIAVVIGEIEGKQTTLVVQHFGKSFIKTSQSQFAQATSEETTGVAGVTQISSGEAIEVTFKDVKDKSFSSQLAFYGKKVFLFLLIFVAINLLLTIFIRIKIQHKPIIIHAILVLIIALLMLLLNLHFVENVIGQAVRII